MCKFYDIDIKHLKCPTFLLIREMQIKTRRRYQYTLIKISKIKKIDNTKCWEGCGTT